MAKNNKMTVAQAYRAAQKSTAKKTAAKPNVDIPKPIKDAGKAVGRGAKAAAKGIGKGAKAASKVTVGNLGDLAVAIPEYFFYGNWAGSPEEKAAYAKKMKESGYANRPSAPFTANKGKGKKVKGFSPGGYLADMSIDTVARGIGRGIKAVGRELDKFETVSEKKAKQELERKRKQGKIGKRK